MQDLFPFDSYRKGQDSFIRVINAALKHKKDVLANVPTGVGKTAATLAPCLKYALENDKHVIFLTSKHTHHKIAIDTLREIKEKHNIKIQVADFIGKRWMCPREDIGNLNSNEFRMFCKNVVENKECEFYRNYHDKSKIFKTKILMEDLRDNIYHVEELIEKCRNAEICSYEAAVENAKKARVVILDYFHVLNPGTRERFFKKINKELENCILIWDESHNLPGRARDLMSDSISNFSLDFAIKEAGKFNQELEPEIVEIRNQLMLLSEKLGLENNEILITKDSFKSVGDGTISKIMKTAESVIEEEQRSFLNALGGFLMMWKKDDKRYSRILKRTSTRRGKPVLTLSINCLDPSMVLEEVIKGGHSNIFMSGTLNPLEMYEEIFGLDLPLKVEYENPFPKENRVDLVVPAITTKFTHRSNEMFDKIAENVNELISMIKGNKIFFFPSYYLIDKVKDNLEGENIFFEESGMDKHSREGLLERFSSLKDKGASLIAVSSGSFGESIDLTGDKLKAVIVVGVPFAKSDLESKEIIRYYDEKFGKGLEYGYLIPAFTTLFQNVGRCIRSEKDSGVIIYLDERYAWGNYRKYFPKSIELRGSRDYNEVRDLISEVNGKV
jgi:DNA excision repair protein ERCC-2